jgi:hypothetical protein
MPRVFLSHSSRDKPTVTRVAQDLRAAGVEVWLDEGEILAGHSITQEIQRGLEGADFVVLMLSRYAVASGWVEKEWQSRIGREVETRSVHIIPARLDACDIPALLRDKLYADFTESYESGLETLLAAIRGHSGQPSPPARARPSPFHARLVVTREAGEPVARWVTDGESEPFPLHLPLAAADLEALRWYLETYIEFAGEGDRARARGIEARMADWGRALFAALFDNRPGGVIERDLMRAVEHGRPALITLASDDASVLAQPWELLRNRQGPLTFQGVSLRRQLRTPGGTRDGLLDLPLRVLLIVSRPSDTGFIDPRNSIPPMLDALDALGPGQLQLEMCEPPTFRQLEEQLAEARRQRQPYHIVHFDGHGTFLPTTGLGALAFERPDETSDLVPAPRLGDLMVRQGVPLVLLEACRGADLSDRPVFGSVAPALLKSGVTSVVAFSHSVHVGAARLLVERFYRELAAGSSIGEALAEARRALHARPGRWLHLGPDAETIDLEDWFIPQLYQVGEDPALAPAGAAPAAAAPPPSPAERMHGFPDAPIYRFHGRARELLALERAFRKHPAVLLHAMGGMGKTALAREAAFWWLRTGRFEAAVFVSFEQWAGAEQVVQRLGLALEGESFGAKSSEEQWRDAVRLFHQRRVLLVWDNFESTLPTFQEGEADGPGVYTASVRDELARLYRELVAGEPPGRLLVTCRPDDTGLPGIKEIELQGLARPDSLHLLAAVLDKKGIPLPMRAEVDPLLEALADHPLSIALVAPHLKERTAKQIQDEFAQLVEHFADGSALESRNRSLLASLEFSKRRLSEAARAVLPYLAWFQGGVFENYLILFAELDPERWQAVRAELVATALVRVEVYDWYTTPFLRFHPTLPFAARTADVPDPAAAEERFIAVYLAVMRMVDKALRGRQPGAGMRLMALEEANFHLALRRAFARGGYREGAYLADTLQTFLRRAGRLRERAELVKWVHEQMPAEEALDETTCPAIREHAWSRLAQGKAGEAIATLEGLIHRLENEGLADGADPASQIALSQAYLGRVHFLAGRPDRALGPLQQAIAGFERLGEAQLGNLSATVGDLANALMGLGRLDQALAAAERGLKIHRELGRDRAVAVSLAQVAAILAKQQRYAEADAHDGEALEAARAAGDLELQATMLQHRGSLQDDQGHYDSAVALYQQALELVRQAGNTVGEMQTADLLGSAEAKRGQLEAAEGWYDRARDLAEQLKDRRQLASITHNLGILHQTRAEQAPDPGERDAWLRRAVDSVKESLAIWLEENNQLNAARSHFQLGVLHRFLGELDEAERNALEGLAIVEPLRLPEVYQDYGNLAEIARARGDEKAAAEWEAKRDAKLAELERLQRGHGQTDTVPDELVEGILALAQAAYQARAGGALGSEAAEALARLAAAPPPFPAIGAFLEAVAARQPLPPIPDPLPDQLGKILTALAEAAADLDRRP